MSIYEQIDNWMSGREDEFVAALAPLIAVDSTTGTPEPGKPFGAGPAKALDIALNLAESWGFSTYNDDGYVGAVDLNDQPDALHILAHLDVVGIGDGWDTDPFTLVRNGDIIYGRGTDDDKGPALTALLAMRCVKELGIPVTKNVRLILGTDEETGSRDIAHYYASHPYAPNAVTPDSGYPVINVEKGHYAPVFTDTWEVEEVSSPRLISINGGIRVNVAPGDATAVIRGLSPDAAAPILTAVQTRTGVAFTLEFDGEDLVVRARGAEAHAAAPETGKNAITALLEAVSLLPLANTNAFTTVQALHELFPYGDHTGNALGIACADEVSGALSITLSLLTVSETGFRGQFDSRTPACAGQVPSIVEAKMRSNGWIIEGEMSPVHVVEEDSDFIRTLLTCYEHYSGKPGFCIAIGGGTYVHNIPGGVGFGAGDPEFDSHLHSSNERAMLSQLLMSAKIYAAVIANLCA